MQDLVPLGAYELATNHPPMPVEQLLDRLSSPHSRRSYQRVITEFMAWIERDPLLADARVIQNYRDEMGEYLSPQRVAQRLAIVRRLYDEVVAQGLMPNNPAVAVAAPDLTPDPGRRPPSSDRLDEALRCCKGGSEAGRRDRALCMLMRELGLQPEDVRELRVGDFRKDPEQAAGWLRRTRTGNEERVGISEELGQALDEYLETREVDDDSPLFQCPRFRALAGG